VTGEPIYHRRKSPTSQTEDDARKQIASQEMWGKECRNTASGLYPAVKAWHNKINQVSQLGIEFTTKVDPDSNNHPHFAYWSGDRDGVINEDGYAKIKVTITFCNQVKDWEGGNG
jgi:hypothetical protein